MLGLLNYAKNYASSIDKSLFPPPWESRFPPPLPSSPASRTLPFPLSPGLPGPLSPSTDLYEIRHKRAAEVTNEIMSAILVQLNRAGLLSSWVDQLTLGRALRAFTAKVRVRIPVKPDFFSGLLFQLLTLNTFNCKNYIHHVI